MPVYEYCCAECGDRFEKLASMARREASVVCPACGGLSDRLISVSALLGGGSPIAAGGCCGGGGGGCACAR